jgi:hypothetical protein
MRVTTICSFLHGATAASAAAYSAGKQLPPTQRAAVALQLRC